MTSHLGFTYEKSKEQSADGKKYQSFSNKLLKSLINATTAKGFIIGSVHITQYYEGRYYCHLNYYAGKEKNPALLQCISASGNHFEEAINNMHAKIDELTSYEATQEMLFQQTMAKARELAKQLGIEEEVKVFFDKASRLAKNCITDQRDK